MKTIKTIKFRAFLSIILLCCIFLPLSECSSKRVEVNDYDIEMLEKKHMEKNINEVDIDDLFVFVPIKLFKFREPSSWLCIFAFSWPVILLPFLFYSRRPRSKSVLIIEMGLSLASAFYIFIFVFSIGKPLFWGYIATVTILFYTFSVILCFITDKQSRGSGLHI